MHLRARDRTSSLSHRCRRTGALRDQTLGQAGAGVRQAAAHLTHLIALRGPSLTHPCYSPAACTSASWVDAPGGGTLVNVACFRGPPLLARPLCTRKLSVFSSGTRSKSDACRTTAPDGSGRVHATGEKRATVRHDLFDGAVADDGDDPGARRAAHSLPHPMFSGLGRGNRRRLARV